MCPKKGNVMFCIILGLCHLERINLGIDGMDPRCRRGDTRWKVVQIMSTLFGCLVRVVCGFRLCTGSRSHSIEMPAKQIPHSRVSYVIQRLL